MRVQGGQREQQKREREGRRGLRGKDRGGVQDEACAVGPGVIIPETRSRTRGQNSVKNLGLIMG